MSSEYLWDIIPARSIQTEGQAHSPEGLGTSYRSQDFYNVMATMFDGVNLETFEQDMGQKDSVILIATEGEVVGFTTVVTEKIYLPDGNHVFTVFSGDTCVLPNHQGKTFGLGCGFVTYLERMRAEVGENLYWMLTSKGIGTYEILSTFFQEYYPRPYSPIPFHLQEILNSFGSHIAPRYPHQYDPTQGVIRSFYDQYEPYVPQRLSHNSPEYAQNRAFQDNPGLDLDTKSSSGLTRYELRKFFYMLNPYWALGDEAVCIAHISPQNCTSTYQYLLKSAEFNRD